jgi:hypothetical protein
MNRIIAVEECDATRFDRITKAGFIQKIKKTKKPLSKN